MAKQTLRQALTKLALEGATEKLTRLDAQREEIFSVFPQLRKQQNGKAPTPARKTSARKPLSAKARKAIAARMKAYWAERRKAQPK